MGRWFISYSRMKRILSRCNLYSLHGRCLSRNKTLELYNIHLYTLKIMNHSNS